jgi:integrase
VGRARLRHCSAASQSGRGEGCAHLRWWGGVVGVDDEASARAGVELLWLSRRPWRRCGQPGAARVADSKSRHRGERGVVPLVRGVRRLPRILEPGEVEALMAALRTERDWAMVQAMLIVGLRGCEVLGLRLEDLRLGEWRVFIAEGKGGHQRLVPVSQTSFDRRPLAQQRTTRGRVDGARVRRAEGRNAWRRIVERRTRRDVDQRDPGRPADAITRC